MITRVTWSTKRFFQAHEFRCRHCGIERMDETFVVRLEELRACVGKPLVVTSGYRCIDHPVEKARQGTGVHPMGLAGDLAVYGDLAVVVIGCALRLGFRGIGISQKGPHARRFIHLDLYQGRADQPRPWIWSY